MFRILSPRFFLTYSSLLPCDTPQPIVDTLVDDFTGHFHDADLFLACLEKHEDGSYHIHVFLFYRKTKLVTDERHFDINGHHPNIKRVASTKRDLERCLNYIKKHGHYWGQLQPEHHLSASDVYMEAMAVSTEQEARSIIQQQVPQDYFKSHINIEAALTRLFPPLPPPPFHSPFNTFTVPRVLSDWWSIAINEHRPMALVLWGNSRMGKTQWARSLGIHDYMKGHINPRGFTDDCRYRIFDDLVDCGKQDWRSLLGSDPFTITGKYLKPRVISPKPTIIISNYLPKIDHNSLDWWLRNTVRVNISVPLY